MFETLEFLKKEMLFHGHQFIKVKKTQQSKEKSNLSLKKTENCEINIKKPLNFKNDCAAVQ